MLLVIKFVALLAICCVDGTEHTTGHGNSIPLADTILPRDPIDGNGNVVIQVGDELLSKAQNRELFGHENGSPRTKRKATKSETRRWTDAIVPYIISTDFSADEKKEARRAMDLFENVTCLKFREATDKDTNKMTLHKGSGGCVSMLGMIGGNQMVDLDTGCRFFGLYLHEIGHALGLIHEQQRPDRHQYVGILWRNVQSRLFHAYEKENKLTTDTLGLPYDLTSVMQYEISAFGKGEAQTLFPLNKWQTSWPMRVFWKTLSITDVESLNKMYKCADRCKDQAKKATELKKCEGLKWKNAYMDKDCNCVTADDHYDKVCVNDNANKACYERTRKGDCQSDAGYMNVNCRKACGSCPIFGTKIAKKMHKKFTKPCTNKYWNNKFCEKWAANGDCDKHPSWMKRYCAKACKTCQDPNRLGKCLNLSWGSFDDKRCDEQAKSGKCTEEDVKIQCSDSCNKCGYQEQGKCDNIKPDKECEERAAKYECDNIKTGPEMMKDCPKTCNSCWFNSGKCNNEIGDKECELAAAVGKCIAEPFPFKKQCAKTCGSCGFGQKGKCDDVWDTHTCDNAMKTGKCEEEAGYYKIMCASTCNSCDIAYTGGTCANIGAAGDSSCDGWAAREECAANAAYMTVNCAKSCQTCYKLNATACYNHFLDYECKVKIEKDGGCSGTTKQLCRKACKECKGDDKEIVCEDKHSGCKKWADKGECDANPVWMKGVCPFSCSQCKDKPKLDLSDYAAKPKTDDYTDDGNY